MSQIAKYTCDELAGAEISCVVIKGDPWFKGIEVATVLGYAKPRKAVYDHVPLKFKNTFQYMLKASKVRPGQISDVTDLNSSSLKSESSRRASSVGKTPTLDVSELNSSWISEAGLKSSKVPVSPTLDVSELKISRISKAGRKSSKVPVSGTL